MSISSQPHTRLKHVPQGAVVLLATDAPRHGAVMLPFILRASGHPWAYQGLKRSFFKVEGTHRC